MQTPAIGEAGCRGNSRNTGVDQVQGELEAGRMAIVSLLAVMTDEQFRSVEMALEALGEMSRQRRQH